jgi:hypothetical protein
LRAVEPEPPKQEEVVEEALVVGPPNAKNNAASNANAAKKDPPPPAPYRYCMPTHAVYQPPKPTARKTFDSFFFNLLLLVLMFHPKPFILFSLVFNYQLIDLIFFLLFSLSINFYDLPHLRL